jgi:penicillin-binding protein-related factor A (putative recombinase)
MIVPSLPDFEGVIYGSGRQIIVEAKVCSQSSYPLFATNKKRPKQIDHMLERAEFGALCFLLIHWNERHLVKTSFPAETFAIPVLDNHFWRTYQAVEQKSLDRQQCELYGFRIPWNLYSSRASKETPDLTYLLPERPEFKLTP